MRNHMHRCKHTCASINTSNLGGTLLDRKGAGMGMNTVTMETSGSNMGTGFVVTGGWFKTSVEDIVLMDHLLRRGKGGNV